MAKKKAAKASAGKKSSPRILGIAQEGTTKGNILALLQNGKWQVLEALSKCRVNKDDSIGWRLSMLKEAGRRAKTPFKLEEHDGRVRLVFTKGRPAASAQPKHSAKAAKKASANGGIKAAHKASVQDVPVEDE